ncbi:MAG: polyprenyl synthetase family protein [Candidatus Eisenbacteria bacterium]|nr:polyprenyl synthetase family protein [Candidatus Eisenbacteria bacterium]
MTDRTEMAAPGRLVTISEIQESVRIELDLVQEELVRFFASSDVALINEIANHVVLTVGKRMRPTLTLLAARLAAPTVSHSVIVSATIVELIHTATLVHDDSIDRSYLRRGLPTVNSLWNDQTAVIMGDYLYSKGFFLLREHGLWEVMGILAGTTYRMSIGEMLELEKKRDLSITEATYLKMIDEKTATLIAAACEIGAFLTFGDGREREALRRFGTELGMAFQITDDLLDFVGDSGHIGKSTGADIRDGKMTLPLIHAFRQAPFERAGLIRELILAPEMTETGWNTIFDFTAEFGGLDYSRDMARRYADQAVQALEDFDDSPTKNTLAAVVDYVVHRRR